jgi:predicted ATPase
MKQILFEGVRCFQNVHSCGLKPITLLVGENSSGKSTFLALTRIAWDIARGDLGDDIFNEEPFLLGSYDQIASLRGGKAGRAKSFTVGLQIPLKLNQSSKSGRLFSDEAKITAQFVSKGSAPTMDKWHFVCGGFELVARQTSGQNRGGVTVTTPSGSQEIEMPSSIRGWSIINRVMADMSFLLARPSRAITKDQDDVQPPFLEEADLRELRNIWRQLSQSIGERPYAFAPIRTHPKRTYDPLKEVPKPEGSHVPMLLARIFLEQTKSSKDLIEALNLFGRTSGLFDSIAVTRKGNKEGDPFQISVKTTGRPFNLVDVGYGVSQALPIVVDILRNPKGGSFLLQQPEVHLHPKAQAELGSFLAALAKEQDKQFIIETHSDYLIDRLRMDVRDKKYLNPDDIVILYFEKSQRGVDIHRLELDAFGNLVDAPSTYRQFFLAEERRMFGV